MNLIVGKQGGAWTYEGNVAFAYQPYCDNNDQWHSVDGDRALVMTENQARLYQRDSSGLWTPGEFLRRPDGNIAGGLTGIGDRETRPSLVTAAFESPVGDVSESRTALSCTRHESADPQSDVPARRVRRPDQ